MNQAILELNLKQLKLPMFSKHHKSFAEYATRNNQPYEEYLRALSEEEIVNRDQNRVKNLIKQAQFSIHQNAC